METHKPLFCDPYRRNHEVGIHLPHIAQALNDAGVVLVFDADNSVSSPEAFLPLDVAPGENPRETADRIQRLLGARKP